MTIDSSDPVQIFQGSRVPSSYNDRDGESAPFFASTDSEYSNTDFFAARDGEAQRYKNYLFLSTIGTFLSFWMLGSLHLHFVSWIYICSLATTMICMGSTMILSLGTLMDVYDSSIVAHHATEKNISRIKNTFTGGILFGLVSILLYLVTYYWNLETRKQNSWAIGYLFCLFLFAIILFIHYFSGNSKQSPAFYMIHRVHGLSYYSPIWNDTLTTARYETITEPKDKWYRLSFYKRKSPAKTLETFYEMTNENGSANHSHFHTSPISDRYSEHSDSIKTKIDCHLHGAPIPVWRK